MGFRDFQTKSVRVKTKKVKEIFLSWHVVKNCESNPYTTSDVLLLHFIQELIIILANMSSS